MRLKIRLADEGEKSLAGGGLGADAGFVVEGVRSARLRDIR